MTLSATVALFTLGAPAFAGASEPGGKPSEQTTHEKWWVDKFGTALQLFDAKHPNDKPAGAFKVADVTTTKYDPPVMSIISGRITAKFNPLDQIYKAGWYGEFGADPTMPAPEIGYKGENDLFLLQENANPLMQSGSITIDKLNGIIVFEFNWGPNGFLPTLNMDAKGHYNFAGVFVFPSAGSTGALDVIGANDIPTLGTDAGTYLLCSGGFCGNPVPEPNSWVMLIAGFGLTGAAMRRRRTSARAA